MTTGDRVHLYSRPEFRGTIENQSGSVLVVQWDEGWDGMYYEADLEPAGEEASGGPIAGLLWVLAFYAMAGLVWGVGYCLGFWG